MARRYGMKKILLGFLFGLAIIFLALLAILIVASGAEGEVLTVFYFDNVSSQYVTFTNFFNDYLFKMVKREKLVGYYVVEVREEIGKREIRVYVDGRRVWWKKDLVKRNKNIQIQAETAAKAAWKHILKQELQEMNIIESKNPDPKKSGFFLCNDTLY